MKMRPTVIRWGPLGNSHSEYRLCWGPFFYNHHDMETVRHFRLGISNAHWWIRWFRETHHLSISASFDFERS